MQENIYDDAEFFDLYSAFPRSQQGLSAAGEWHELEKMLPDFADKRVLDIGCGFGWHCLYAAEHGAAQVIGTDISQKMLNVARRKSSAPCITYQRVAMEDLNYAPASFDVVLSSLALHYSAHFSALCHKVASFLGPGGVFVFSVEHPVFTAAGSQQWAHDATGRALHWPVDNYFREGQREAVFLGKRVLKQHRTLTTYIQTLWQSGFALQGLVEPQPPAHLLASVPGMEEELRRPMMLILKAVKREGYAD